MARYAFALEQVWEARRRDGSSEGRRASVLIGACLVYLLDCEDVIPDHICGQGYLDDAFVFEECLRRLTAGDRNLFLEQLNAADAP